MRWKQNSSSLVPGNVVQTLVDAYPAAIHGKDRDGNKPMDIALEKEEKHGDRALGVGQVKLALADLLK